MNRTISIITRDESGKLNISANRVEIDCDQNHTGIDAAMDKAIASGAIMVIILLDDDSVARHWTAPPQKES